MLQSFALRRGIHYKLLSDPDSKLIDAFGIRNLEATGNEAGVPIPNYFLIGKDGVIVKRHAETGLTDRVTASYFYESVFSVGSALPPSTATLPQTPHVKIELLQSDRVAAPGTRIRLSVQIDPGKGAHLYAPGSDRLGYHSVRLMLDPSTLYSTYPSTYPKSTLLRQSEHYEAIPIFSARTIITQDVAAIRTPETMAEFEKNPNLTIRGVLEYQVCTDTACFPPTKASVQWYLDVKSSNLDLVRAPESLRKR